MKNAETLFKHIEHGKEYYFKSGVHAVIIRKKGNVFEYLELQDSPRRNGFKPLTIDDLKERFEVSSKMKDKVYDYIIDIEKIKDSPKFRELLGFFNTKGKR